MIDRPTNAAEMRRAFRRLHEAGCFVIANPWDVGGVRFLQSLGFKALATTSSGHSWSQGVSDGAMPLVHIHGGASPAQQEGSAQTQASPGRGRAAAVYPEGAAATVAGSKLGAAALSIQATTA